MRPSFFFFLSFSLISFTLAAPTSATNFATRDTGFSADPSIDVAGILSAAQAATADSLASFPHNSDAPEDVEIFGDWANLPGVSAFHFFADMDVDCDGSVSCSNPRDVGFLWTLLQCIRWGARYAEMYTISRI